MKKFARPRIVVSKCLEFEACRYNGQVIPSELVRMLMPHVEFIPVCAEFEIGLGVPREPVRIVDTGEGERLVQPASGRDVTGKMAGFADKFLSGLPEVDGFILKSRSPSCGIKDVKVYAGMEKAPVVGKGPGKFGGPVQERYPNWPVEDEGRLLNFSIREHFLTRVFALARFREVLHSKKMSKLVEFQASNKYLLMGYNQTRLREMGRLSANPEKKGFDEIAAQYGDLLRLALLRPARRPSMINVLMHAQGYFTKHLSAKEKAFFLDMLEKYRSGRLPVVGPLLVLRDWVIKYDMDYLSAQTIFEPYPEVLADLGDSGTGRDLTK